MSLLMSGIGFGIISGAILSIGAIGFSLQFGMTNVMNLSYGSVMTIAALATYELNASGVSVWIAAFIGMLVGAVLTIMIAWFILRPFARKGYELFQMAMVSVGVSIFLDYLAASITRSKIYQFRFPLGAEHHVLGMLFSTTDFITIGISLVAVALIEWGLHGTRLGVAIRATSANSELARASGIYTQMVSNLTWLVSGLFCGLAGVTLAMSYRTVSFTMGTAFLPYILAVVILAGVGSIGFAAAMSVALTLVIQVSGAFGASSYNVVIALGVLLVTLLVRPQGLFGRLFEKKGIAV